MRLIDADRLKGYLYENYVMYDHTLADIDAQPTVDAEPVRHGHWIGEYGWVCSECGYRIANWKFSSEYLYCPNCGAKMDEVKDEIH